MMPLRTVMDMALGHQAEGPHPPSHHRSGAHQAWCPVYGDLSAGAGPGPTVGRRRPKRRDDSGLTTLEWLLIVAAVAGLAALAVVLVQSVVDDTAEEVGGSNARLTAARIFIGYIDDKALAETDVEDKAAYTRQNLRFARKCDEVDVLYTDVVGLKSYWIWPGTGGDPGTYTVEQWRKNFIIQPGEEEPRAGCRLLLNGKEISSCC